MELNHTHAHTHICTHTQVKISMQTAGSSGGPRRGGRKANHQRPKVAGRGARRLGWAPLNHRCSIVSWWRWTPRISAMCVLIVCDAISNEFVRVRVRHSACKHWLLLAVLSKVRAWRWQSVDATCYFAIITDRATQASVRHMRSTRLTAQHAH
jgi:hypothetical protein